MGKHFCTLGNGGKLHEKCWSYALLNLVAGGKSLLLLTQMKMMLHSIRSEEEMA